MFTQYRFRVPNFADAGIDDLRAFAKALHDYLLSLESPNVIGITKAKVDSSPIGASAPSTGAFTTLSASSLALTTPLPVTSGGTGRATGTTAYGLLAAGTTATGAHQTLAAGLTTEILVGGGAAALPAWTAATGSGAPVRAVSPALTGTVSVEALTASGAVTFGPTTAEFNYSDSSINLSSDSAFRPYINLYNYESSAAAPGLIFHKARGTRASPSAALNGDVVYQSFSLARNAAGTSKLTAQFYAEISASESGNEFGTDFRWRLSNAGVALREVMRLDRNANLGLNTATFGTNAAGVFAVLNGTAPTTGPADTVQFYSSDDAAGHTIPSFYCEGTNVIATGQADSTSTTRVKMRINGTVVTLLAV